MTRPHVAVIGLGCIGGSLARSLTSSGAMVRGWSSSAHDRSLARRAGVDAPERPIDEILPGAELVVIAVPVQAIAEVAAMAIPFCAAGATIVHCGGVQSRDALHLDARLFARVIGAHPLAGSHESGFAAARADLFDGCTVSIESRRTDGQRECLEWLWRRVGAAQLDYRSAAEHDAMMVWISHLPQLAATALAATFAAEHIDPASVGPGARDTTRLAASAFEQWSALVRSQPVLLDTALAGLQRTLGELRAALTSEEQSALRQIWSAARDWRRDADRAP